MNINENLSDEDPTRRYLTQKGELVENGKKDSRQNMTPEQYSETEAQQTINNVTHEQARDVLSALSERDVLAAVSPYDGDKDTLYDYIDQQEALVDWLEQELASIREDKAISEATVISQRQRIWGAEARIQELEAKMGSMQAALASAKALSCYVFTPAFEKFLRLLDTQYTKLCQAGIIQSESEDTCIKEGQDGDTGDAEVPGVRGKCSSLQVPVRTEPCRLPKTRIGERIQEGEEGQGRSDVNGGLLVATTKASQDVDVEYSIQQMNEILGNNLPHGQDRDRAEYHFAMLRWAARRGMEEQDGK